MECAVIHGFPLPAQKDNEKKMCIRDSRYLLENEKFRLYYTAAGEEAHNFIVVVEDNFGDVYKRQSTRRAKPIR